MATFIENPDESFASQLDTFCLKIDTYAAVLALDAAKVTQIKKDNLFYKYTFAGADAFKTFSQNMIGYKDLLRRGHLDEVLPAFPATPVLAAAPTLVPANVQKRFADLIQDCVRSNNYTTSIGEDLGIQKPESPFVPNDGKPKFKIEFSSGGHPNLIWTKGKFQGVEIWKDDGAGWKKLDRDFNPDYIDKTDLPLVGTSKVWKYKMIYIYKDEIVGAWSVEISITVYGNV